MRFKQIPFMSKISLKVRLFLYHKGKILLLRQTKKQGGNYTLVGGTIEDEEFAIPCLIREAEEESGIILKRKNLQLAHILHKHTPKGHRMTLYFKASKWDGAIRSLEPKKFEGAEWFSLKQLPPNLTETVSHVLQQYRKGKFYSEFTEERDILKI